jgi:hypothetical protein
MFKVSIVPDTNILLSELNLIKLLYSSKFPFIHTVNYSKTVISELEVKKTFKVEAREAIRFIEEISMSLQTEIEGKMDERKVEIEIIQRNPVIEKCNDDKILNYLFKLENPILLTNDKAFHLKCISFNIKSILIGKKKIGELITEICREFGMSGMDSDDSIDSVAMDNTKNDIERSIANAKAKKLKKTNAAVLKPENKTKNTAKTAGKSCGKSDAKAGEKVNQKAVSISKIKNSLKNTLLPTIILILERELGLNYELSIDPDSDLVFYLDFVVKNFHLFRNFLPSKTVNIITKFLKSLNEGNIEEIRQMIHPICMIFRKSAPPDI